MKIKITYSPEEELAAAAELEALKTRRPDLKVRRSETHPPFKHIYLADKKPLKKSP